MSILIFYLVAGLILLFVGGNLLVKGASNLALLLRMSSLVIGLTVVAYGTSFPELAVSSIAALKNEPDLTVGNVVGSNIFNILFTLGICAVIRPLKVHKQLVRIDVPILIGVSILFYLLSLQGALGRREGLFFIVLLALYTLLILFLGRKEKNKSPPTPKSKSSVKKNVIFCLIGLAILLIGAETFIRGAQGIALALGISEFVVGLTIVAAGTSLPELVSSLIATFRKETDIAVGNVIGSNIFNILGVMGVSALISPHPIPIAQNALYFDQPILCITALACLPIFFSGHKISRWEGVIFLFYYLFYLFYLYSLSHPTFFHRLFFDAFIFFITPLTLLTLGISFYRHWKPKAK